MPRPCGAWSSRVGSMAKLVRGTPSCSVPPCWSMCLRAQTTPPPARLYRANRCTVPLALGKPYQRKINRICEG